LPEPKKTKTPIFVENRTGNRKGLNRPNPNFNLTAYQYITMSKFYFTITWSNLFLARFNWMLSYG